MKVNYKNESAREYVAPQAEVMTFIAENFTLSSKLEDYDQNIIC